MVRQPDGDDDSVKAWPTATVAEAMTVVAVLPDSNSAAMPTATQSAANGGPAGNKDSAVIAML